MEEKKERVVKLYCPKCKEVQDCYLIDFSLEHNKITVKCKECGTIFIQVDVQKSYDHPSY